MAHQIIGCDGVSCLTAADDHIAESLSHITKTGGQGQYRHNLTGHGDVKLALEGGGLRFKFIQMSHIHKWVVVVVAVLMAILLQ